MSDQDTTLFLYKNTMLVESMDYMSIFFHTLFYDPKEFDFYYGKIETIDFENWYNLVVMPYDVNIISHYMGVKQYDDD